MTEDGTPYQGENDLPAPTPLAVRAWAIWYPEFGRYKGMVESGIPVDWLPDLFQQKGAAKTEARETGGVVVPAEIRMQPSPVAAPPADLPAPTTFARFVAAFDAEVRRQDPTSYREDGERLFVCTTIRPAAIIRAVLAELRKVDDRVLDAIWFDVPITKEDARKAVETLCNAILAQGNGGT